MEEVGRNEEVQTKDKRREPETMVKTKRMEKCENKGRIGFLILVLCLLFHFEQQKKINSVFLWNKIDIKVKISLKQKKYQ